MFEQYTEKARRAIFFARFEVSQYGSCKIETEHLLLGVLREEQRLAGQLFPVPGTIENIRKEIEAHLTRGPRISASVEIPLSEESTQILNLACESADRLGHRHVDSVHLVLAMLRVEKCAAARLLLAHDVDEKKVEASISEFRDPSGMELRAISGQEFRAARREALEKTVAQVVSLWTIRATGLGQLFATNGQFGDSRGRQWSGAEIEKGIEAQFASDNPEVEKVTLENIQNVSTGTAVATLRMTARDSSSHRLVLVLRDIEMQWRIVSAHISLLENS